MTELQGDLAESLISPVECITQYRLGFDNIHHRGSSWNLVKRGAMGAPTFFDMGQDFVTAQGQHLKTVPTVGNKYGDK